MSMSPCTHVRTSLGVYVLGGIEPAERSRVDLHLQACPQCRDELAGLAGLPALLSRVTEEQIAEVIRPPGELFEATLTEATARRMGERRRRRLLVGVAAVAVLMLLGGGTVVGVRLGHEVGAPAPTPAASVAGPVATGTDPATDAHASVQMSRRDWGTAVDVRLTGLPYGTRCRLFAIAKDGRRDVAASWWIAYESIEEFKGSTMIALSDLARFEIRTIDGAKLLTIPVR